MNQPWFSRHPTNSLAFKSRLCNSLKGRNKDAWGPTPLTRNPQHPQERVGSLAFRCYHTQSSTTHNNYCPGISTVMACVGFGSRWRWWIQWCISTTKLTILVNGSPTKEFFMEKGLRQGDSLSTSLFNIATKGLSRMLKLKQMWFGTYKRNLFWSLSSS